MHILTNPTLFDLLHRSPKNRENLDHNLNDHVHHLRGRPHFYINLETSEKRLNALEDVDKNVLACPGILSCLRGIGVKLSTRSR